MCYIEKNDYICAVFLISLECKWILKDRAHPSYLLNRYSNFHLDKEERAISIHIGVHAKRGFPHSELMAVEGQSSV